MFLACCDHIVGDVFEYVRDYFWLVLGSHFSLLSKTAIGAEPFWLKALARWRVDLGPGLALGLLLVR
jgi:hypothetical protein